MKKLTIGVITYNNPEEQLAQLSKSLRLAVEHLTVPNRLVELLVIDNGAESHWPEPVCNMTKSPSQGNIGFSKGMNCLMDAAFRDAACDAFLCLNPDGALHRMALQAMVETFEREPLSLLEARQFPEEHPKPYDETTFDTPWASGACLLIPRVIWQRLGGFDSNLFMYLEDVDLSWRARSAGFSVKVVPNALFGHAVLGRKPNRDIAKFLLLSGRYLARKWGNEKFLNWAEGELVSQGFFASRKDIPAVVSSSDESSALNFGVADFDNLFYFSIPRWT